MLGERKMCTEEHALFSKKQETVKNLNINNLVYNP